MDPRHLFADERPKGFCVHCGGASETRDHCPSEVLLDEPLPPQLAVIEACGECNQGFSKDGLYVACLIESIVCGSAEPGGVSRPKIKSALEDNPALASQLRASQHTDDDGNLIWNVKTDRVRNVFLKLARGHVAYELTLPQLGEPDQFEYAPITLLSEEQRSGFESPGQRLAIWPEIGSRAFIRASKAFGDVAGSGAWIVVQPGRYRYLVDQSKGTLVQIVLSEYLVCRIAWD